MARGNRRRSSAALLGAVPLEAERLEVYDVVMEFHQLAALPAGPGHDALWQQLDRASRAVLVNVAEAANRTSPEDGARHDALARAWAEECAALIDSLRVRGLIAPDRAARARSLMVRTARMLTGMVRRWGRRGVTGRSPTSV